jgi:hypothetical protein
MATTPAIPATRVRSHPRPALRLDGFVSSRWRDAIALLFVVIAAIPAIWPLTQFRFSSTHDGTYHLLRLVEFNRLFRQGEWFPGWFPDFASGYGYPLLSYYPPFSYYPAEFLHLLGFGFVDATKAALGLAIVLSGIGAYLLGRDVFDSRLAGALTAVAFMVAPYHLIDTYVRAILSESWAFPFLPLSLWSLRRSALGSRAHVGLAALWLACLTTAHNVIALFFMPVALTFALGVVVFDASNRRSALLSAGAAFALGLLVSSAYWLPALAENGFVSTTNFNTAEYRPERNLNGWDELIATEALHEYAQSPFRFGLVQVSVAVLGLAALPWAGKRRWILLFAAGVTVLFGLLLTEAMAWVWSRVPLIAYVQFPTRLLSIASIGTAVLAGGLALWPAPVRFAAPVLAAGLIVAGVARIDPPPMYPRDEDLTIATLARFEHDSGIIGTTTAAEYLPVWARAGYVPPTEGFATPAGTANEAAIVARVLEAGPLSLKLAVETEQGAPLRFHTFYFPGWSALIDGEPATSRPSAVLGLLTVDVPAGAHVVEVRFGPTPLRLASIFASLVGLIIAGMLIAGVRGVLVVGSVAIIGLVAVSGTTTATSRANWSTLESASSTPIAFAGGRARAAPGGVEAELYWLSSQEAPPDRPLMVRLVDGSTVVAESNGRPIAATSSMASWHKNELVRDWRSLRLRPGFAGGPVDLEIATAPNAWRKVGSLLSPAAGLPPSAPATPRNETFGDLVTFTGVDGRVDGEAVSTHAPVTVHPGDRIELRLVWLPEAPIDDGYTVFVHLIDSAGVRIAQQDNQPGGGFSPTTGWQRGIAVDDTYRLRIPAQVRPGLARIVIGLYRLGDLERLSFDGRGTSELPVVSLRFPGSVRDRQPSLTDFGGEIALLQGERQDGGLRLRWQALGDQPRAADVFVHVLDERGRIIRQADGPPLGGNYPFDRWQAGEIVEEMRTIGEVPTNGSVIVGLYDPVTGARWPGSSGADFVRVP